MCEMLVVVESPWRGLANKRLPDPYAKSKHYLRQCLRDCLVRGEIPWASHAVLAWTRALYEEDADQRAEGIQVCKDMIQHHAQKVVLYVDFGITTGMHEALIWARMHGKPTEERRIYGI